MKTKIIGVITVLALMAGLTPAKANDGRLIITTVIGAAAGGVLGAQFGKGDGKLVATAAGTLLGAAIGHSIGSDNEEYYESPVVYSAPSRTEPVYGNKRAVPAQETVIIEKKIIKHIHVYETDRDYKNKYHGGKKDKNWKKKNYQQIAYSCRSNSNECRYKN